MAEFEITVGEVEEYLRGKEQCVNAVFETDHSFGVLSVTVEQFETRRRDGVMRMGLRLPDFITLDEYDALIAALQRAQKIAVELGDPVVRPDFSIDYDDEPGA